MSAGLYIYKEIYIYIDIYAHLQSAQNFVKVIQLCKCKCVRLTISDYCKILYGGSKPALQFWMSAFVRLCGCPCTCVHERTWVCVHACVYVFVCVFVYESAGAHVHASVVRACVVHACVCIPVCASCHV